MNCIHDSVLTLRGACLCHQKLLAQAHNLSVLIAAKLARTPQKLSLLLNMPRLQLRKQPPETTFKSTHGSNLHWQQPNNASARPTATSTRFVVVAAQSLVCRPTALQPTVPGRSTKLVCGSIIFTTTKTLQDAAVRRQYWLRGKNTGQQNPDSHKLQTMRGRAWKIFTGKSQLAAAREGGSTARHIHVPDMQTNNKKSTTAE